MLTKNLPRADVLFNLGTDIPGCKYNEVYTMDNFVSYLPRQYMVLNLAKGMAPDEGSDDDDDDDNDKFDNNGNDLQIPIFGRQIYGKDRGYEYTICSYRAIMKTDFVYVNAMFRMGIPLHFYADFDLSIGEVEIETKDGEPIVKNVASAMKEALECIDIVIKEEREVYKNPTFACFDGKYTVSVTYGHREAKESAHIIFHMTGLRMFEDVMHCKYFYYKMLQVSNRRYPNNKRDNPLYFKKQKTGEYVCIMDSGVYTKNRMFRHVGQIKIKADPYPNNGALYPDCGSPTLVCRNPTCIYHVYRQISEFDFCINDARFIPRNSHGVPFMVERIKMPKLDNPDSRSSRNLFAAAAVYGNQGDASLMNFLSGGSSSRRAFESPIMPSGMSLGGLSDTNPADLSNSNFANDNMRQGIVNASTLYMMRRDIMNMIASMITAKTKYKCTFKDFNPKAKNQEVGLITSDSLMCPYLGKRENPRYTPTNVVPVKHETNHIYYIVALNLPMPTVLINCSSPVCSPYVKELSKKDAKERLGFEHMKLNLDDLPEAVKEAYMERVVTYMSQCEISSDTLFI